MNENYLECCVQPISRKNSGVKLSDRHNRSTVFAGIQLGVGNAGEMWFVRD